MDDKDNLENVYALPPRDENFVENVILLLTRIKENRISEESEDE